MHAKWALVVIILKSDFNRLVELRMNMPKRKERQLYEKKLKRYIKAVDLARRKNVAPTDVIVIIKFDGIGDMVIFQPAAEALRLYYKDKKLVLCCGMQCVPVAQKSGYFDEVIGFFTSQFNYDEIDSVYERVKTIKCDLLLHPTSPKHIEETTLASLINAKKRIGAVGENGALKQETMDKLNSIYDVNIDTGNGEMQLIQTARFIRGCGIDYLASAPTIRNTLSMHICLPENFFVIFVGGSVYNKKWPAERFYHVAEYIKNKMEWDVVLCGGKGDEEDEFLFSNSGDMTFYSFVGMTTMDQLTYIISKAKLVVSNDTSAAHISAALRVPTVCIRGDFSGDKFFPYILEREVEGYIYPEVVSANSECKGCTLKNRNYECINDDYFAKVKVPCILNITQDMVVEKVNSVLKKYF